jgi:hypothetical protein
MSSVENTPDAVQDPTKKRKRPGRGLFFESPAGRKLAKRFSKEYSGRPQPGKLGWAGSRAVSNWDLAKRVARGEAVEGMKQSAVDMRAKSLGLAYRTAFFSDQGEPFTDGALQALRERLGFTTAKFEKLTGLGRRVADTRGHEMIRDPRDARIVIEWRDKALRSLLAESTPAYKNHRVLKTFLPDIADLDGLLRDRFAEIQNATRDVDGLAIAKLGDLVCEQAQRAAKKSPNAGLWGELLRCLTELDACRESRVFLERNLGSLKDCKALADFVREIIAARYGTTAWTVKRALPRSTRSYSPAEMRGFVLDVTPASVQATPPKRELMPDDEKQFFIVGRQVNDTIQTFEKLIALRRALPKRARAKPELVKAALNSASYTASQIGAGFSAKSALIAARAYVSGETRLQFSVVAKYHRQYLKLQQ